MIDLLALEHQLRDINQELKRLRARRNSIRQTLAKHGAYTRVAADYFSKDIWAIIYLTHPT